MTPTRPVVPIVATLLICLAACTGGGSAPGPGTASAPTAAGGSTSGSASPPSPSGAGGAPSDEPAEPAAFPADAADDGGAAQPGGATDPAGQMHVTALRVAAHDGYDRLVVELSSSGTPRWTVGYSTATGPGGGPVTIDGDAFLRLSLFTQADPGAQTTVSVPGTGLIAAARTTGFFEGYEEVLVGIRNGRQPFRAFALADPGRIVIDVRHPA